MLRTSHKSVVHTKFNSVKCIHLNFQDIELVLQAVTTCLLLDSPEDLKDSFLLVLVKVHLIPQGLNLGLTELKFEATIGGVQLGHPNFHAIPFKVSVKRTDYA